MEVDALDMGIRAVLSQRNAADGKLSPYTFFSRRNYDVLKRKHLALLMELQEWHHWLERAA